MWGNILAFLERLDDELFKSLQCIDPHTQEYVHRLKDEPVFLVLAHVVFDYFMSKGDTVSAGKASARSPFRMEYHFRSPLSILVPACAGGINA